MLTAVQLLQELIALPSVNPAVAKAAPHRAGEARVAEFLELAAKRVGLDVERHPVPSRGHNVLIYLHPKGKARQRILLAPHMDTVDGEPQDFEPVLRNGRVYGRGACDDKGSVAAMFTALSALARGQRPASTEVVLGCTVDEEIAQSGSRALVELGFEADLAVVGEPTRNQVVTSHKGDLWLQIETRGKAAHGATPELGRNAVHEMAQVVHLLETDYARALKRRSHPLLGHATISVNQIAGGVQPNTVADHCVAFADRRTLPGETESTVRREILQLLGKHNLKATVFDSKPAPCLPLETDPRLLLVRRLMECAGQTQPAGVQFFCDASVLAHGGIPSVVFGPGDVAQAHGKNEWVSVKSVERATACLVRFLQSLS